MTKTKKRKMSKSTFAIIIMAVVMVAMLAFGGTYAYFTASATARTGTATTGYVKLDSDETFQFTKTNVMPGDQLIAAGAAKLTVYTTDPVGNYVAIKFTITATDSEGEPIADVTTLGLNADSILANAGEGWYASSTDNIYIYGSAAGTCVAKQNGDITINAEAFTLSKDIDDNWTQGQTASDNKLMGATITIKMEARSIQASHLTATDAVAQLVGLFA